MKTLEQIRNEVAADHGWVSYDKINEAYRNHVISQYSFDDFFDDVAKIYLKQNIETILKNKFEVDDEVPYWVVSVNDINKINKRL